jgi:hypothetical protein
MPANELTSWPAFASCGPKKDSGTAITTDGLTPCNGYFGSELTYTCDRTDTRDEPMDRIRAPIEALVDRVSSFSFQIGDGYMCLYI